MGRVGVAMAEAAAKRKVTRYQSFPDQAGGSLSDEKLKRLRLPALAGQSFLDVGCNEGFFCGFAQFEGASRVVGLDMNAGFIELARQRFPGCEFLNQSWDDLPGEGFDVILLASALHYAKDQPALIARLMAALKPEGTLVLEIGIADGTENVWVPVKRSIDERFFATWPKMREVLAPYAWKNMGASVRQAGDPVNRVVIHVHHRRPMAYLLMMPPAYGKTFISNALFGKAGLPVVNGDLLLERASRGEIAADSAMKAFLGQTYQTGEVVRIVKELHAADLLTSYVGMIIAAAGGGDFAFDGYVPPRLHDKMKAAFQQAGYLPVILNWDHVGNLPSRPDRAEERARDYLEFLASGAPMPDRPASSGNAAERENGPVVATAVAPAQPPVHRAAAGGKLRGALRRLLGRKPKMETLQERWQKEGTIGHIDTLKASGRVVTIGGWAVGPDGKLPPVLIVRFAGKTYEKRDLTVQQRPDVQKHLQNNHSAIGYEIEIYVDRVYVPAELPALIAVTAGEASGAQSQPFRMSKRLPGVAG